MSNGSVPFGKSTNRSLRPIPLPNVPARRSSPNSKGVFPSDLAWVMLWEQLYRSSTIIRGTSYHHE
ncbi:MAG: hypothetical protein EOP07_23325 [Proteobacteria bacterium]|nr:MAG: hypothetical protein EOP07_23325 [Pseudomonadota bacterium]